VNYLDVAAAYARHDWSSAINSYWSPLYSWLLAATMVVARPAPSLESTVLHAMNFFLFLSALFCGEFFLAELMKDRTEGAMPEWALWCIGYSLLLFVSLFMNPPYLDTPDLGTSAFVYLAAGLLVRIRTGKATPAIYAALGIVLALAYFSKTVMFLVAFAFFAAGGMRRRMFIAVATFAVVALPWIAILSQSAGHLTYGDAGKANYIKYVSYAGSPLHPLRFVSTSPEFREFATPIRATYPPWYAPPYWIEGLRPRVDLKKQVVVLENSIRYYFHLLSGQKEFVLGVLVILAAWPSLPAIRWHLLLPPLCGFWLYAMVHVEPRLVGVFFFLLWSTLFAALRVRARAVILLVTLLIVLVTAFKIIKAQAVTRKQVENVQWKTADGLRRSGLTPGALVAVFGHGNEGDYWAHLGGFRVVADIEREKMPSYWSARPEIRADIRHRLKELGVQAVVLTERPAEDGWQPVSGSPYWVRFDLTD